MGANAQVALEKFARYFEVEARILPVSQKSNFRLDPDLVKDNIDENTIGIFVILGKDLARSTDQHSLKSPRKHLYRSL